MSGNIRTRSTRRSRHRAWRIFHRTAAVTALAFLVAEIAVVAVSSVRPQRAQAAAAPTGQNFTVTPGDLHFIMKQIKIAEQHASDADGEQPVWHAGRPRPGPDPGPADAVRPADRRRLVQQPLPAARAFRRRGRAVPAPGDTELPRCRGRGRRRPGTGSPAARRPATSRRRAPSSTRRRASISNLIVDQTSTNPAAVAAAGHPVRTQDPTASACRARPTRSWTR